MAKKPLLSLPINAHPARFKFVKKYKSLTVERGQDYYVFGMNAQNIFFFSCLH